MRRTARLAALALVVSVVAVGPPARAGGCEDRSWTGGTTEWCEGVLVYRDYVYDDYGADRGDPAGRGRVALAPTHGSSTSPASGDVDHRDHGQRLNSADLLVLRLEADGDELVVHLLLNTLFPDDHTVAALALDTDADPATGGGHWGVVDVASGGWERVHLLDARDPEANTITGRVPLPPGDFRVQAVVALGDGTPMNVAFRPDDRGNWWEDEQAAALAAGDVSAFGHRVDAADLGSAHRPASPPGPGYHERVLRSDYPIAEGVDYEGWEGETTAAYHYLGPHQPYALYVPSGEAPHGVQLLLHGAGAAHSSVIDQPGMQGVMGEDLNRVLVSPLARGYNNSYVDWGARDVLDSLADVEALLPTDPDAVFVSGYSMGGGGTLQLSTMFPDRFAGAIDWVGFTGDCLNGTPLAQGRQRPAGGGPFGNDPADRTGCPLGARGNAVDFLDNLRHVPSAHLFAAADELVWANHAVHVARRMEELGYVHRLLLHAGEHFTFAVADDWRKEAEYTRGLERVERPARVTYRTNPFLFTRELDLVPDGAYWVDELTPRNDVTTPAGDMVVDLTSHACDSGFDETVELHRDAGTEPVPWVGQEGVATGTLPPEPGARISGELVNVESVLLSVEGACFEAGEPFELDVAVDGPTLVRFDDGRPDVVLQP